MTRENLKASVEQGAITKELRHANAAFIAHWNPEFAAEVVHELQRLWRVEGAARRSTHDAAHGSVWDAELGKDVCANLLGECEVCAALANPAAERWDPTVDVPDGGERR